MSGDLTAPDVRRRSTSPSPISPTGPATAATTRSRSWPRGEPTARFCEFSRDADSALPCGATSESGYDPRAAPAPGTARVLALSVAASDGTRGGRLGDRMGRADVHSQRPGFRSLRADIRPAPRAKAQSRPGEHT